MELIKFWTQLNSLAVHQLIDIGISISIIYQNEVIAEKAVVVRFGWKNSRFEGV